MIGPERDLEDLFAGDPGLGLLSSTDTFFRLLFQGLDGGLVGNEGE